MLTKMFVLLNCMVDCIFFYKIYIQNISNMNIEDMFTTNFKTIMLFFLMLQFK